MRLDYFRRSLPFLNPFAIQDSGYPLHGLSKGSLIEIVRRVRRDWRPFLVGIKRGVAIVKEYIHLYVEWEIRMYDFFFLWVF